LRGYHPDLLFAAAVDLTKDEVLQKCHESPGDEYDEGDLHFTQASFDEDTLQLLAHPAWVPGDEASLFRAIEFLERIREQNGGKFLEAFEELATAP
jgi:hypothetical protein